MSKHTDKLQFLDECGTFRLNNPENINQLYFPLCNEAGIMSSITPMLHGDSKTGQHNFILPPVSIEDLHSSKAARNFWFYVHGNGAWSATGNSAEQNAKRFTDRDTLDRTIEAGFLWHKLILIDHNNGLMSEILNFVPSNGDTVEIMYITLTNSGNEVIKVTPTSAIPLYGRSAENIRDHRHVTSLVNRLTKLPYGISMKPEIIFNEHGHKFNKTIYYILGSEADGKMPTSSIPVLHSFIGKAGGFDWPEAVVKNMSPDLFQKQSLDGKEYVGALRFMDTVLLPGEKKEYIILTGICDDASKIDYVYNKYNTSEKVKNALNENKDFWEKLSGKITFASGLDGFSNWMRWVAVQPVFRKIYGCSFLPYHDYGKGGRGWRDLWQDCLSLILQSPQDVRKLLIDNFGGVRLDGTNATIIGAKPGEFIADRNNIARVWMDHGSWPYLTTRLYIDQSGDFGILLEKQVYFKDAQIERASKKDELWNLEQGQCSKTKNGSIYMGTVLEHILVQHLTSFFNVGEHNIIRLEGADWNDTLDMARERGESVAFTAFYGSNLISLSELILKIKDIVGLKSLELFEEFKILLDTLTGKPYYNNHEYKKSLLNNYFEAISRSISDDKINISIIDIAKDLRKKGEWIYEYLRQNEWIETSYGDGFFNGYYNNDGQRVDGENEDEIRINLTAQVFTTMFGLATDEQAVRAYKSCQKYLKDPITGGYRLNTDLGDNKLNFGRGFAFAYGEKENGSTFCHMVVMYMNALYKRGLVNEAYEVFKSIYNLSTDTKTSSIYPGIPEYFSATGKGMYPYLTGSASWLLLTVVNEMYGIRGEFGELILQPKLKAEQFDELGHAAIITWFKGRKIKAVYSNSKKLDYTEYRIKEAELNGKDILKFICDERTIRISEETFENMAGSDTVNIKIELA